MVGEQFISVLPSDSKLREHIAYYYFHQSHHDDFQKHFIFYPHYQHALTAYLGSNIMWGEWGSIVTPGQPHRILPLYSRNTKHCMKVKLHGQINKIGVVFKTLGINHFTSKVAAAFAPNIVNKADFFEISIQEVLEQVFKTKDIERKTKLLDQYFNTLYHSFEAPRLLYAVEKILKFNGRISGQALAKELNINRKTLLRWFNKHLCSSIEAYKSLVKFRNALNHYQAQEIKPKLTQLAYDSDYYDQADFIHHFKAVTGLTPKQLFASIHALGGQDTYWTIEDG